LLLPLFNTTIQIELFTSHDGRAIISCIIKEILTDFVSGPFSPFDHAGIAFQSEKLLVLVLSVGLSPPFGASK